MANIWYSSQQIDTYQRLYNFIIGLRGVGKTYHFSKKCISASLKDKLPRFVWVRRLIKDADNIKGKWWMDVENEFPNYTFENVGYDIYARDKSTNEKIFIGEIVAVNDYISFKSIPHPYTKYIIFDEFMAEGENKYTNNEVEHFLNLCDSIIRCKDDVKVYFLGNAVSMLNPYFEHFGIGGDALKCNFIKGKDYVVENCDYKEFKEYRSQTKFGQSIKDTNYGSYAIDNKFLLDDTSDIEEPKYRFEMMYNLRLHNLLIAVKYYNGMLYFDVGKDESFKTYSPYAKDCKNWGCILLDKNSSHIKYILKLFLEGGCSYRNLPIKNEIQKLVLLKYKNYEQQ